MSTTLFVLEPAADTFEIITTGELGPAGPPGAAGASATPGMEITDPYITPDHHVAFDYTTNWGLSADGVGYYEPNPLDIPPADRAMLDPYTLTMSRGGPGRADAARVQIASNNGGWTPFGVYDQNTLVTYNNSLYFVTDPFMAGPTFDTNHLVLLVRGVAQ